MRSRVSGDISSEHYIDTVSTHGETSHKTVLKLKLEGPLVRAPLQEFSRRRLEPAHVAQMLDTHTQTGRETQAVSDLIREIFDPCRGLIYPLVSEKAQDCVAEVRLWRHAIFLSVGLTTIVGHSERQAADLWGEESNHWPWSSKLKTFKTLRGLSWSPGDDHTHQPSFPSTFSTRWVTGGEQGVMRAESVDRRTENTSDVGCDSLIAAISRLKPGQPAIRPPPQPTGEAETPLLVPPPPLY
ncbi:hypothetical protein RRG08_060958 [Elysia crispata]|uniref:Uncharacterized protein n=1 Tax=Elysia crispata TaxID=231223 RepID=A0AAE1AUR7_9GAST|nr:hypothetical protein RRG08_060958 [Elysia crispata]